MRRDVFVYLSGPMSAKNNRSVEENVANALKVHLSLILAGIPNYCPHLSGIFPSAWVEVPYETWLALDFAIIDRCTHMLMLPHWDESNGAQREKRYAVEQGKVIAHHVPELLMLIDAAVEEPS